MATIIRRGSKVHAGLRTGSGDFLGGACRYKGEAQVVGKDTISMISDDQYGGTLREFAREDVHHEQDCPRG